MDNVVVSLSKILRIFSVHITALSVLIISSKLVQFIFPKGFFPFQLLPPPEFPLLLCQGSL
jgi:hypothetical protein